MRRFFRWVLNLALSLCLLIAAAVTAAGFLAPWWPFLEMFNHFRPFVLVGVGLLLGLSLALRSRPVLAASAGLFTILVLLLLVPFFYAAPQVSAVRPDLTIATLNTWMNKGQADQIVRFAKNSDADIILLQEVGPADRSSLLDRLAPVYPHIFFDRNSRHGPAILSRRPWRETGVVAGRGRPVAVWARFEQAGQTFEVASVHAANPFEPNAQVRDVEQLIAFVRARDVPIVMGGDFNLTPFSWKLTKLAYRTGLRWAQTFEASWPANRLAPLVLLDHILVPDAFALVGAGTGPRVGSDHLPVVARLAFATGARQTARRPLALARGESVR